MGFPHQWFWHQNMRLSWESWISAQPFKGKGSYDCHFPAPADAPGLSFPISKIDTTSASPSTQSKAPRSPEERASLQAVEARKAEMQGCGDEGESTELAAGAGVTRLSPPMRRRGDSKWGTLCLSEQCGTPASGSFALITQ